MDFEKYNRSEIGSLILQLRETACFTQKQLAEKAEVSPSTVSNVEKARGKKASHSTIKRLLQALGVHWKDVPELLRKENTKQDQFLQTIELTLMSIENQIDYGHLSQAKKALKQIEQNYLRNHPYLAIVDYLKGKYFYRKGKKDWSKAHDCFLESISRSTRLPEMLQPLNITSTSYHELGRIYFRSNNYYEALRCAEKGLQSFKVGGKRESTRHSLLVSKVIYLEKLERIDEAKNVLTEVREYEGVLDTQTKLNMFQSEVNLLYKEKNYTTAIQRGKQAIEIARRGRDYDRSSEMWTTLGSIYKDLEEYQMAEICFKTAAQWRDKINDLSFIAFNETEFGKLFALMGDTHSAELHLENAVEISKRANDVFYEFEALSALADLRQRNKKIDDGVRMLEEACQLAYTHGLHKQSQNSSLKLAEIYKNIDQKKHQQYLSLFFEISVQMSREGGEEDMSFEELKSRAGSPPEV